MSLHTCTKNRSLAARRAAVISIAWHNAGETNWITGRVAPAIVPIRKMILPPLTPTGVITQATAERIDASMVKILADYETRRLHALLTTGEELP